jgi:anti-sigma B factor antagonist
MQQAQINIHVRQVNPKVSVMALQGDLSASAEDVVTDAYHDASAVTTRAIILDCTQLAYMNSSGIGLLVTLFTRMKRQGQRFLCCGLSEHYRHIFHLIRMDEYIEIYNTESEALARANNG